MSDAQAGAWVDHESAATPLGQQQEPELPRIAYYCMACPEVFYNAKTSNAHHDATGHHQHWLQNHSYAARQGGAT